MSGKGLDEIEYKKHFHRHQQDYIRKRLRSVKLYYEGHSPNQICEELGIHAHSCRTYSHPA